jgi:hypothetical protein
MIPPCYLLTAVRGWSFHQFLANNDPSVVLDGAAGQRASEIAESQPAVAATSSLLTCSMVLMVARRCSSETGDALRS